MDGSVEKYKVWAEIDLDALRHNFHAVRARVQSAAPDCRVIAAVKADAYGHGERAVCRTLYEEGCDFFAVSCLHEAQRVRDAVGDGAEILQLGYSLPEETEGLVRCNVIQAVFSEEYAYALNDEMARLTSRGALPADARLRIHLKLDTGMNRIGFDAASDDVADSLRRVLRLPHLHAEGMFTHFATADTDGGAVGRTGVQLSRFAASAKALSDTDECPPFLHCCNSAAVLTIPSAYMSAVRAGIVLYGLSPDGGILPEFRPVMKLCARVAHVHTLRAGESVSYGAEFTAERDMRIATVSIGYGDGFLRAFRHASLYLQNGTAVPVLGRICMDQCMIDIGEADVRPGDVVTVFGGDDGTRMEALSRAGGTIHYEITTILTPRVPRVLTGRLPAGM